MFALNISIGRCGDHTFATPTKELMNHFTDLMLKTVLIVYGRKTCELMIP